LSRSGLPQLLAVVLATPAIGLLLLRAGLLRLLWLQNLAGFAGVLLFVVPPLAPLMQNQRQTPVGGLPSWPDRCRRGTKTAGDRL